MTIADVKRLYRAIRKIETAKAKKKNAYSVVMQHQVELEALRRLAIRHSQTLPVWSNNISCAHFKRASARFHRIARAMDIH